MNEVNVIDGKKTKAAKTFRAGDIFRTEFGPCILAQVDTDRVALITLVDGNRINSPVGASALEITEAELNKMGGLAKDFLPIKHINLLLI